MGTIISHRFYKRHAFVHVNFESQPRCKKCLTAIASSAPPTPETFGTTAHKGLCIASCKHSAGLKVDYWVMRIDIAHVLESKPDTAMTVSEQKFWTPHCYRVGHLLADLGWVDLDLGRSSTLPGQ